MNMGFKRRLSVLILLVLLAVLLVLPASADSTSGDWKYITVEGGVAISGYKGSASSITVPSTIGGQTVLEIYSQAFQDNTNLTSVRLPDTIRKIDGYAFWRCKNLTSINFPEGLQSIGISAFSGCSNLTEITFPVSLKSISGSAFNGCKKLSSITVHSRALNELSSLKTFQNAGKDSPTGLSVVFTDTVTVIPSQMFIGDTESHCYVTSVTIPASVTEIGYYAFADCYELKTVSIPAGGDLITIYDYAFNDCTSLDGITLPDRLESIGANAFSGCRSLTSITFPEDLVSVKFDAFTGCWALEKITVKSKRLSNFASTGTFENAGRDVPNGISVVFTDTATRVPANMFAKYSLDTKYAYVGSVSIGKSVTEIRDYAFSGCANLKKVTFASGSTLTTVGYYAFSDCTSLSDISLPVSLQKIDSGAFSGCTALTSITLPENLTQVNQDAFTECRRLANVTVRSIALNKFSANKTFKNAGRDSANGIAVVFTDTVTKIPANMFYTAESSYARVSSVSIGRGVTEVGASAFNGCFDLDTIRFTGSAPSFGSNCFYNVPATVYYPSSGNWSSTALQNYGGQITWVKVELPKITKQPASVAVAEGEVAKVSVTAAGKNLTYKWYFKNADATKFSYTSSFSGNTYSTKMDSTRANRQVYCVITDAYGNSITTKTVTLSMKTPLTITTQPKSVTVAEGETAKVTVKATGDGLTYRWYYKDAGKTSYTYTSSFKSNTYSVQMNVARNGRRVLCKVYDKYGNMVQSSSALLSMQKADPVKITAQPVSVTVAEGATAKVTVKATGDGLTYQWYFKDAGASKFSLTTSFKSNTYSVSMTDARNGRQVYCKITDKYGNTVTSSTATLKMEQKNTVQITTQPKSVTVAEGETAKVTVKATGDGLTYKWYYKDAGKSSYTYTSSFKSNTYSVTMNAARNGRRVLCKVYDKYGNMVQSSSALLSMK